MTRFASWKHGACSLAVLALCACGSGSGERWALTHDADAGERLGDCALTARVGTWTEVAELHLDSTQAVVLLEGMALLGTYEAGVLDAEHTLTEDSADVIIDWTTRYQLDLSAQTGTALTTRFEERGGSAIEDCVEEVPLALQPLR